MKRTVAPISQASLVAVTGSQRPYIYDLPLLLSLPDGFEYRFRYHRVWISGDVEKDPAGSLVGQPLVLIFHSQERKRLLPLRRCSVVAVDYLGPLVFVRFAVGPFVRVSREVILAKIGSRERETENARLDKVGRELIGAESYDLSKELPRGVYFRRAAKAVEGLEWVDSSDADTKEASLAWAALASLLMDEKALTHIPMFQLLGFQGKDGEFQPPKAIRGLFAASQGAPKGFRIVEGERYRLRILEWCETIKGPSRLARIVAAAAPHVLALEGSSNLVVGGYDVLEFSFRARRPGYTELSIGLETVQGSASTPTEKESGAGTDIEAGSAAAGPPQLTSHGPGARSEQLQSESGERPPWPVIYSARVPVMVKHNWPRIVLLGWVGVAGGVIYLILPGKLWELLGLLMMFTTLGEYLERFVKFSGEMRELASSRQTLQPK
jgi:hypothetical protein